MRHMDRQEPRPEGQDDENQAEFERLAHGLGRAARRGAVLGRTARKSGANSSAPAALHPVPPAISKAALMPPAAVAAQKPAAEPSTPKAPVSPARGALQPAQNPARSARDVAEQAAAANTLDELRACVAACEACSLSQTRTHTVFMDGRAERGVMFVGEAPGAEEDKTGVPFVGRSGQLLTDIITKGMGIPRQEVAIANVLKCRPPDNRPPTPAEKTICTPWLDRQIALIDPQVIIPLGRHAAMHMLKVDASMGALRQQVHEVSGRKIIPTFHPAYLLRSPGEKKECWKDIQLAMGVLGMDPKTGS